MSVVRVVEALSFWMFAVGVAGVVIRQSPLSVFMSIELMLNAANLLLVLGARTMGVEAVAVSGLAAAFFVVAVAAAEVAVGLAIMVAVFRREHEVDLDRASSLKG